MKLSQRQQEVIDLMKAGWELGRSIGGLTNRSWMQKDGLGRGGETKDVHSNTFFALEDKGLIEVEYEKYPRAKYRLTNKGRRSGVDG